ncbi:MAG: HAD-IA family hydrolase [Candidatus Heimdallarchaeota archaeon]|nr:HAD-IA family hydrolase [Candidatus Heimdallarchaeota archaeon]
MEFITSKEFMIDHLETNLNSLFIDFDDTLVDYPSAQNQALQHLLNRYELNSSEYPNVFDLYHSINNSLWPMLEKGEKSIPQIREERFKILKQSIPIDDTPTELDRHYLDYFVECTQISKVNLQYLQTMKDMGYNIIITTNGIRDVQRKRIIKIGIDSIIDDVITSEDVGKAKPAPLMYETIMDRYSIHENQVFIIGDSLSSDIMGANNAKIRSCWLNYGKPFNSSNESPKPDIIANDFSDISSFITNLKNDS